MSDIKKKYNDNKLKSGASEVIPKYAKALKLLKAKSLAKPSKIGSVTVGLRKKDKYNFYDNLLHTNYTEDTINWFLAEQPLYNATKVKELPITFIGEEKFPIVPFGNQQVSDSLREALKSSVKLSTLQAFEKLFPKKESSGYFKIGSESSAMEKSTMNVSKFTAIFKAEKKANSEIKISSKALIKYLIRTNSVTPTGNMGSFTYDQIKTLGDYTLISSTSENLNYYHQTTENGILEIGTVYFGSIGKDPGSVVSIDTLTYRRNDDVSLNDKTVVFDSIGANSDFISYKEIDGVTDVQYAASKYEIEPQSNITVNAAGLGDHYTSVKNPPKELSDEQVNAYLNSTKTEEPNSRGTIKNYYKLLNEVVENINSFSNNENYFLSISKNFGGIGEILTTQMPDGIDFNINFADEYNDVQTKKITVITERKNCNDAQIVEMPVFQRISESNLRAEIFHLFVIKQKENVSSVKESFLTKSESSCFFSGNYNHSDLDIQSAYNEAFSKQKQELDIEKFFNLLYPEDKGETTTRQVYAYKGTKVDRDYKVVGSERYVKFRILGIPVYDYRDVKDYVYFTVDCSLDETAIIKSAVKHFTVTFKKPEENQSVKYPEVTEDELTIKTVVETYNKVYINGDEKTFTTIDGEEVTSINGKYTMKFDNNASTKVLSIPYDELFGFILAYDRNLKNCFTGYDKPVESLSLLDIITREDQNLSEDISRKYFFTPIQTDGEILESGITKLVLEDISKEENGETQNLFKLKGTDEYLPKHILTDDLILQELIHIS